ncbi:MAG: hypothetical protein ACLGG7_05875 [Bacteriovoracia bacterium]
MKRLTLVVLLGVSSLAYSQGVQIFNPPGSPASAAPPPPPARTPPPPAPEASQLSRPSDMEVTDVESTDDAAAETAAAVDAAPKLSPQQQDLQDILAEIQKGKTVTDLVKDPELRVKLVNAYQKNPISNVPEVIVEASVTGQLKKTAAGSWLLENVPAVKNFLVEFMRHPEALGKMLTLLNRLDDLLDITKIAIVVYIVMYFVRRQILFTMESRWRRRLVNLAFSLVFYYGLALGYGTVIDDSLAPTWELVEKHFF